LPDETDWIERVRIFRAWRIRTYLPEKVASRHFQKLRFVMAKSWSQLGTLERYCVKLLRI
jgi:hypothetical protein